MGFINYYEVIKMKQITKEFNKFIKKWCGNNYPHLIDSDENDGEMFRELLEKTYTKEEIRKSMLIAEKLYVEDGDYSELEYFDKTLFGERE